jgi:hypothetical protein
MKIHDGWLVKELMMGGSLKNFKRIYNGWLVKKLILNSWLIKQLYAHYLKVFISIGLKFISRVSFIAASADVISLLLT